jgi:hypothetical protein
MGRWLVVAVVLLTLSSAANAESTRKATPNEIGKLLLGCWLDHETIKVDGAVVSNAYSEACFHADGRVDASWFGVESREGFDGTGRYGFVRNKLVLRGPAGWIRASRMACDTTIVPGKRLKLIGCIEEGTGADPALVQDYTFVAMPGRTELE